MLFNLHVRDFVACVCVRAAQVKARGQDRPVHTFDQHSRQQQLVVKLLMLAGASFSLYNEACMVSKMCCPISGEGRRLDWIITWAKPLIDVPVEVEQRRQWWLHERAGQARWPDGVARCH